MLANYVNSLEGDKQKLKAQVKRLCAENNWLRKELTEHQQLLQETELQLVKAKEEKEHMDFLLTNKVCKYCYCRMDYKAKFSIMAAPPLNALIL